MPGRHRHRRGLGSDGWAPGNLSRLVEPSVLYLLASGAARHGYEVLQQAQSACLTDAPLDAAAVYRTLRALESEGCVVSSWEPGPSGPARRIYVITAVGVQHLRQWVAILEQRGAAMLRFAEECRALTDAAQGSAGAEAGESPGGKDQ